ncbi:MAG: hypothetical protein HQL96_12055 [Magnetococcales bacterium]|nr:hypothetical protein [Magnetococcales bacterium]
METVKPTQTGPAGKRLIGVRIPDSCMVYRVHTDLPQIVVGDQVVVQIRDGEVIGQVLHLFTLTAEPFPGPIRKVIRRLTEKDRNLLATNQELENKARLLCRERIRALGLSMKLSKITCHSGGARVVIHFTSEARVDFRELVRQLSSELKARVEMRHVGVRDESKLLCGLGCCGKVLCCSEFLTRFHPVSVRMAKNQDLSLTPEGISGVCGRLMCCLAYENDVYLELRKGLPKVKSRVTLPDGREGMVRAVFPLLGEVELLFGEGVSERMPVERLTGVTPTAGAPEEEGEERGERQDAPPPRPVVKPKRSTGKPSAGAPPSPPAVAREAVKKAPVSALVALLPEEEGAAESASKRPRRRRRSAGNKPPGVVGAAPAAQSGEQPVRERSEGEGTEGDAVAPRPAGTPRRRRRRSGSRRGGEGGGEGAQGGGGEE